MTDRRKTVRRVTAVAAGLALTGGTAIAANAVTSADTPEGTIVGADAPDAVKDSYIVVLKDTTMATAEVGTTAEGLAETFGGSVENTYSAALNGFEASMSEAEATKLAADPSVAYVEQNSTVTVSETQSPTPSWGLDRLDQDAPPLDDSYTYGNAGEGVTAYIVDTGILTSHTDFGGRAVHGIDTIDGDDDATDCQGHGTHVAGTVGGTEYGVAKGVELVGVRVLDCDGSGTDAGVIEGIEFVAEHHEEGTPAVANMSLGGSFSQALNDAVAAATADGVTFAVAAGNESQDACATSPASEPSALTVGATEETDTMSSFSNYGECLDIFAPGTDITSAWIDSDDASNTISGTSMASPHVAGAAALVLGANPAATPDEVGAALVDGGVADAIPDAGVGSPNVLLNVAGI